MYSVDFKDELESKPNKQTHKERKGSLQTLPGTDTVPSMHSTPSAPTLQSSRASESSHYTLTALQHLYQRKEILSKAGTQSTLISEELFPAGMTHWPSY